jgi:hypothetical protein
MAHRLNIEFYLYTGFNQTANDAYAAYQYLKSIDFGFQHLHYGDPAQHEEVLVNLRSWFPDQTEFNFPFMTYSEIYANSDTPPRVPRIVIGKEAIFATDWKALENFSG